MSLISSHVNVRASVASDPVPIPVDGAPGAALALERPPQANVHCGNAHAEVPEEILKQVEDAGRLLSDAYAQARADGTLDQYKGPGFFERIVNFVMSFFEPPNPLRDLPMGGARPVPGQ